jgi:hypothetical protein
MKNDSCIDPKSFAGETPALPVGPIAIICGCPSGKKLAEIRFDILQEWLSGTEMGPVMAVIEKWIKLFNDYDSAVAFGNIRSGERIISRGNRYHWT